MKPNIEKLIQDDLLVKKPKKKHKVNIIFYIFLFILISQTYIIFVCQIFIRDHKIDTLTKHLHLEKLNNTLQTYPNQIKEKEDYIRSITNKIEERNQTKLYYEKQAFKKQEQKEYLSTQLNRKKRIAQLAPTITSFLPSRFLEKIEEMTKCTLISNCYRMTRDGYSAKAFHDKCDGLKPTVALIYRAENEAIFGGITYESWDGIGLKYDNKAFLFSLIHDTPYKLNEGMPAINVGPNLLPTFGIDDIYVDEKEGYNMNPLKSFSTSSDTRERTDFKLKELEVFHMNCGEQFK